ncbi:DUF1772 domain-containing protein [Nocardiopsis alba]|jgi:uncharacterized membrane protein|uniref:DUF1772 domain-containing protein n=1 Tax=Nocardiopsis alba TaxID=53437 RepID=UPI0033A49BB7
MTVLLVPLAVLTCGLAAGGLMISALGGAPLLLSLPDDRYVPVHQFLVTRFDPFMPANMIIALLADLALVLTLPDTATRVLAGACAVLLAGAIAVSLLKNVPINRWVATLDPEALPENFAELDRRTVWRDWNLVRTALVVTALVGHVLLVGLLL